MDGFNLTKQQIKKLRAEHRRLYNKKHAYRINAIILLGSNWTYEEVAEALLLDKTSVRNYFKRYEADGLEGLLTDDHKGSFAKLDDAELIELEQHLEENIYQRSIEIIQHVKKTYRIEYKVSGITDLLIRLGFVYKKPKKVPGKADVEKQEAFIEAYKELKEKKGENDPIYFMDGCHPQHNTQAAYGWIKRGKKKEIKTNSGRERLNINGAIDIEELMPVTDISASVNAQSTIRLFKKLENKHPSAEMIYVIADNAKYYKSELVKEYLETSKIKVIHIPPYAPNLNLIERLWLFYKKTILYNKYYETFEEFKNATKKFFRNAKKYKKSLSSLLTENFEIIGAQV